MIIGGTRISSSKVLHLFSLARVVSTLLAERSWTSLPTTGDGLRWKSCKKARNTLRWVPKNKKIKSIAPLFVLYHADVKALIFHLILLTYSHLQSSPPTHVSSKSREHSRCIAHASSIFIIAVIILIVIVFWVTLAAVLTLIGNLKYYQKSSAFPLVRRPTPLSLLFVEFWHMSLWLDVSNLPLKIPQQMSSAERVVPLESCLLPQECWRGRCLSVCCSAALVLRSRLRTRRTCWNMMCFHLGLADQAEELVEKSASVALLVLITAFPWTPVEERTEISSTDRCLNVWQTSCFVSVNLTFGGWKFTIFH